MELKYANSNGYNFVINSLNAMIYFFPKMLKIELNKGLQSLFKSRKSITICKPKLLVTFISLIKMKWFKDFHVYVNLENQFQIFVFEKSDFFICLDYLF